MASSLSICFDLSALSWLATLFHFLLLLLLLCFAPLLLFISLLVFTHLMVSLGPVPVISHDLEVLPVATDPPLSLSA